ncbi:MAG: phosphatidylserine decarboxylase family protein [Candidatus Omnitrophota bacterium]
MNNHPTSNTLMSMKRLGEWLPTREATLCEFRKKLAAHVKENRLDQELFPVVRELAELVNTNPILRMYFTKAISQAVEFCHKKGYELGYTTFDELIGLINGVMTQSISFDTTELVGCPLNALLDWPMCMPSGFSLFRFPELNAQLKNVLNFWCNFLSGPDSRTYLNDTAPTGWFCNEAIEKTQMMQFECDPTQPYWGFTSWNNFFTRRFKPGERPVASPNDSKVIVSACEATPYNIQTDVKLQDTFWIKSQPYSLQDMFTASRAKWAELFVGGSVYQAFLSAYNFHRWNTPVTGTIVDAYQVDGTYYSDATSEGLDPAGPNNSQGYITAVAARAVVILKCDDPALGHVACVFVGMAEISSCIIDRKIGEHVQKGDELGYFQYGGSTHCLIFQPGVIQSFIPKPPFDINTQPIAVNSQIATAN